MTSNTKFRSRVGSHLRRNLVALTALFIVLGGTAVALPGKNTVDSGDIHNKAVKTKDIAKQAVTEKKLADGSVSDAEARSGRRHRREGRRGQLPGPDQGRRPPAHDQRDRRRGGLSAAVGDARRGADDGRRAAHRLLPRDRGQRRATSACAC